MALILSGDTGPSFVQSAAMPTGSVLQVLLASRSTAQSISTTTYTDLTDLSITITPKFSTSKFLLTYSIHANLASNGRGYSVRFVRNGTALYTPGGSLENYSGNGGDIRSASSNQYLDSPATTSPIIYKLQAATWINTTVEFCSSDVQNTFTVMEIAG